LRRAGRASDGAVARRNLSARALSFEREPVRARMSWRLGNVRPRRTNAGGMSMSISLGGDGKGRRKTVDSDLNLVPYIDLLTCMVAFLLITSIWTQLARLEVAQKGQGQDSALDEKDHLRVAVLVSADSFNLIVKDDQKPIPKRGATLDYARLVDELKAVKLAHPTPTTSRSCPRTASPSTPSSRRWTPP
jgi:biopolymer transport protein TolR